MSKRVFPTINSVTLSGEVVSAPIKRATRVGPKLTTFIIEVSSGSAKPARIAVASPVEMSAGLSEALKVGVEVVVEGQLIAAPVRGGRGLTPLRISATRIHALGPGGLSQEISASAIDTGEMTDAQPDQAVAEKPKRRTVRSRPENAPKSRPASAISVQTAIQPAEKPAASSTSDMPEAKVSSVVSQHGRRRRRFQVRPEESHSLEPTMQVGRAASPASATVSSKPLPKPLSKTLPKPLSKRPAKSRPKKTGVRSRKTTSRRPEKPPDTRTVSTDVPETPTQSQKQPPKSPVKSRPARPARPTGKTAKNYSRAAKPTKPRSKPRSKPHSETGEITKPGTSSDSPFALTQSESSFDPFLVDDKD